MRIVKHQTKQIHPVPDRIVDPRGPFPRDLFAEPEIVYGNIDADEYGGNFALGSTAQNEYKPPRYLRCGSCFARVLETETSEHVCEE